MTVCVVFSYYTNNSLSNSQCCTSQRMSRTKLANHSKTQKRNRRPAYAKHCPSVATSPNSRMFFMICTLRAFTTNYPQSVPQSVPQLSARLHALNVHTCCRSRPEKLNKSTSNLLWAVGLLLLPERSLSRLLVEAGLRPCPIAASQLLRLRRSRVGVKLLFL